MISEARVPIQIRDIQESLLKNIQLRCSHAMIRRFLRFELGLTYK